jgi:hypothetical protein
MRVKFPQILCFDDWVDLYKLPDTNKLGALDKSNRPFANLIETPLLKETRSKVLSILEKNSEAVKEIELAMVLYNQIYTAESPSVYLAYVKDAKTDLEYLTAKTFWPLMDGNKKEIRIYIGSKKDFPDHKNLNVRFLAKQKMREHLKSKLQGIEQAELF